MAEPPSRAQFRKLNLKPAAAKVLKSQPDVSQDKQASESAGGCTVEYRAPKRRRKAPICVLSSDEDLSDAVQAKNTQSSVTMRTRSLPRKAKAASSAAPISLQASRRQRVHNKGLVVGNSDPNSGNETSYPMRDSSCEAFTPSITVTEARPLAPLPQSTSQEATATRNSRDEDLTIDNESMTA